MLDLKQECSVSEDQDTGNRSNPSTPEETPDGKTLKKCTDCSTITTPLWRGGPAGPKTLCNACGIKFHKKRRALLGIEKGKTEKMKKKSGKSVNIEMKIPLKIKLMTSGGIRQSENVEVEQAAMLLMALSYGSVFA